jgi:hypothetical protein
MTNFIRAAIDPEFHDRKHLKAIRLFFPYLTMDNGPWIAGGAARRVFQNSECESGGDIDVYFPSLEMYNWGAEFLRQFAPNLYPFPGGTNGTTTAVGGREPFNVQLHCKHFPKSAEEILYRYDFSVTKFVTDGEEILYDPECLPHLKNKLLTSKLKYSKPKPKRLGKYCSYGFTPTPGMLAQIMNINDPAFGTMFEDDLTCGKEEDYG